MKYYAITLRCGHVGRQKYIPITFPIQGIDLNEAINEAIKIPRVKSHTISDVIDYKEVSYFEYKKIQKENNNNDYLHATRKSDCYSTLTQCGVFKFIKKNKKTSKYHYRYLKEKAMIESFCVYECY